MLVSRSLQNRLWFFAVSVVTTALIGACALVDGNGDGSSGIDGVPTVTLSVSNPTPQVNEQVTLTCSVTNGTSIGVTFDFLPDDGSLIINHSTGIALLIIAEHHVGTALTYTCTGTNINGTSRPSADVVIVPTQ